MKIVKSTNLSFTITDDIKLDIVTPCLRRTVFLDVMPSLPVGVLVYNAILDKLNGIS